MPQPIKPVFRPEDPPEYRKHIEEEYFRAMAYRRPFRYVNWLPCAFVALLVCLALVKGL